MAARRKKSLCVAWQGKMLGLMASVVKRYKNDQENVRFSFRFLYFSKNDRFVYGKNDHFKNDPLVLNFQKTKNNRF